MKFSETDPRNEKPRRIYCDHCHGHTVLTYTAYNSLIEDVHINIKDLPVLSCTRCQIEYLPDRSISAIAYTIKQAIEDKQNIVNLTRKKIRENFEFTDVSFIYDPDDYYYIPGLKTRYDPGFLTPVFFNKAVLLKFDNSSEYRISFASKTYGHIKKDDEYRIPFGINDNKKVIMWLGDIATLPKNEQYYLRSENIESDHMIGSEFYDGQIECVFTDLSPEDELIKSRSEFHESAHKKFGKRLTHLDRETLSLIDEFNPPVVHSEKEKLHIADILNKINVESLDSAVIGTLLAERGIDYKKYRSLKRLEKLFECEFPDSIISSIFSPLFVLYDLRLAYSHLTSNEKNREILSSVCRRLSLHPSDDKFEEIYSQLIGEITQCYAHLATLCGGTESANAIGSTPFDRP